MNALNKLFNTILLRLMFRPVNYVQVTHMWARERLGFKRWSFRARSIQPKFPEISVQNSMDRFGPTGNVSKKRDRALNVPNLRQK